MAAPSSPGRLSRFAIFLLLGGLVLVLAMLGYLNHVKDTGSTKLTLSMGHHDGSASPVPTKGGVPAATVRPSPTPAKPVVDPAAVAQIAQTISDALKVLRDPNNPNKSAALDALRDVLRHADPTVAIAAIRQFLASGDDARTGLGFRVGEGGALSEAPTMRTFLMDELGSISRDAGTLADIAGDARATLAVNRSPDENALAMRNLGWADPNGSRTTLAAAERSMLDNSAWRQSPTGGYLEAFDVAAYAGDASLLAELSDMGKTPSPVQRAALVAMERLSALSPGEVVSYLNAHPDILADRPLLRADYVGNVDLSDAAQRTQAEVYLQRTDVSEEEKEKFIGRLVTPAGFVSDNLLTPSTIPLSLPEHQALVNTVAQQWLASGKYPALQTALQTAIASTGGSKP